MNKLLTTLDKMLEVLASLADVMASEQQQLSGGQINSSLLQRITEDKSSLLATLNFLEQMRRDNEKDAGFHAPYSRHSELSRRWSDIQEKTIRLRDTNLHNGLLLSHQISFTDGALEVLRPHHTQKFYGPDGQATSSAFINRKV
ncbi:flagellar export chaperone FlgN [Erwinia tracheiphila]|uniref:Flagellar biosynthesis protein FlgN n=1 Tax=Erwinia tracheiphila TaxID=65700 RepID=A0A0M2KD04_9GAMM|nr:flagellar export chaperone FlgN [Erwinia tracheiphila]AXF76140.1 flagellar biosynthesis protein FlgN [Erwinia tracheiphila]EOS96690.1 flagellar biosynthesis protein [Erwinia tracheiphila PSU-1]KKF34866.1 flagellar biosynthesis protein FlgN [Erwinia tracheiphila]UIA85192.1 flagellar export chaperone FlgN [Erwinia tracheiphila]UIA86533.1 flagellar export chaperone FlgN [Erwinia tracheiphila]